MAFIVTQEFLLPGGTWGFQQISQGSENDWASWINILSSSPPRVIRYFVVIHNSLHSIEFEIERERETHCQLVFLKETQFQPQEV